MAVELANSCKKIKFDVIDTWRGSPEHQIDGWDKQEMMINDTAFDAFQQNMLPAKGYYNPIKLSSMEASKLYQDGSLDFVFIDADKERYVQYFDMVFPMVRLGGIIAADNILEPARYADHISKYTSYVRSNPKVISQLVPIDNGEEITIKISA